MVLTRRALALLLASTLAPLVLFAALFGFGDRSARAQNLPVLGSPNVDLLSTVPGTAAISGVFSRSAPYFYVSGLDAVTVLDVSDPRRPVVTGKLVNALFENEAMTLGERKEADGTIRRFVLLGNDLVQAAVGPGGIQRGRIGGGELIVVDVTDPTSPEIVGRTPSTGPEAASTSTHTVACMDDACATAYSAGDSGKFSVFDLSDLEKPRQIAEQPSPAAGPNPVFTTGSGHHWHVDGTGVAWHTGSGGTAAFDISDPRRPLALTATNEDGTRTPYNDFIHHNAQRPNGRAFRPGRPPSIAHGNVALVTEEDYVNDGDEVVCDRAGTFQTWEIQELDGRYRAQNPALEPNKGTMRPLDRINPVVEGGGGLSAPAGAFCSAHWFDTHQSGIVAQGFYQQGLRLIDVRDPRNLEQFGYFTAGVSEVWDAYWVPERDASGAAVPGRKTNVIYTVDAVRGVDVLAVRDLPADLPVSEGPGLGTSPTTVAAATGTAGRTTGARPCRAPVSRVTSARLTRRSVRLRGAAAGRGCGIARVTVAVGLRRGSACRWLRANGTLSRPRACSRPLYVRAAGRDRWSLRRRARLPRGRYVVRARAVDAAGNAQRALVRGTAVTRRVR